MPPVNLIEAAPPPAARGRSRRFSRNTASGLFLVGLAALGGWASSGLPLGRIGAIGPGVFPLGLAGLIAAIGAAIVAVDRFAKQDEAVEAADFAAVLVVAGFAAIAAITGRLLDGREIFGLPPAVALFAVLYGAAMTALALGGRRLPAFVAHSGLRGPFFVVGGLLAFAATVGTVGLLVAGPLLAVISGGASRDARPAELLVFAALIPALSIGLFKYALHLPLPVLIVPGLFYL